MLNSFLKGTLKILEYLCKRGANMHEKSKTKECLLAQGKQLVNK